MSLVATQNPLRLAKKLWICMGRQKMRMPQSPRSKRCLLGSARLIYSRLIGKMILLPSQSSCRCRVIVLLCISLPRLLDDLAHIHRFESHEYYVVGHDTAKSLFEESILDYGGRVPGPISFFFAGIGDGRHMFATLLHIAAVEKKSSSKTTQTYHFTINDLKAAVLARDLIICMLLQDLSELLEEPIVARSRILCTLFFVYSSRLMPKSSFAHLQEVIERALAALDKESSPLTWFQIRSRDMSLITKYLRSWQGEGRRMSSPTQMVKLIYSGMKMNREQHPYAEAALETFKSEETIFVNSGFLYPPDEILKHEDAKLQKVVSNVTKLNARTAGKELKNFLGQVWSINPTTIDIEWQKRRGG